MEDDNRRILRRGGIKVDYNDVVENPDKYPTTKYKEINKQGCFGQALIKYFGSIDRFIDATDEECQKIWAMGRHFAQYQTIRLIYDIDTQEFRIETNDARSFASLEENGEYLSCKNISPTVISVFIVGVGKCIHTATEWSYRKDIL